jgi:hypothetical protein
MYQSSLSREIGGVKRENYNKDINMKRRHFIRKSFLACAGLGYLVAKSKVHGAQLLAKSRHQYDSFVCPELLGRPTDNSVSIKAIPKDKMEIFFEYGLKSGTLDKKTDTMTIEAGEPAIATLNDLKKDTPYFYKMNYKKFGERNYSEGNEYSFRTQRENDERFTFAIQSDPHHDDVTNYDTYKNCIINIGKDNPDFLIDIGDTSMAEKLAKTFDEQVARNLLARKYFDEICHSIPLFMGIGNHDGENGWRYKGNETDSAVVLTKIRKKHFLNPQPNDFYTGDKTDHKFIGLRENYYAWNWGNALFVVLDPYWYTKKNKAWGWSLGKVQYDWFNKILEESKATFKFVFCHHLVGGLDLNGVARGGIQKNQKKQWGGKNADGTEGFEKNRPGWGKPIHEVMVDNKVSAFFHGHDHFYCQQELDGIIYQLMPQPSIAKYDKVNNAKEYGYVNGKVIPNSGYLRGTISKTEAKFEYVRAYHEENPGKGWVNGKVEETYTIKGNCRIATVNKNQSQSFRLNVHENKKCFTINFSIPTAQNVQISIYDLAGREIRKIANQQYKSGNNLVQWDGKVNNNSKIVKGIYLCRMKVGESVKSLRFLKR